MFSYTAIIHTSTLSCKQPETTNSHETEGGETQGQRDCPPINPCNEIGQYSGASAHPSMIGQPATKKMDGVQAADSNLSLTWQPLSMTVRSVTKSYQIYWCPRAPQPGRELATCIGPSLKRWVKTACLCWYY